MSRRHGPVRSGIRGRIARRLADRAQSRREAGPGATGRASRLESLFTTGRAAAREGSASGARASDGARAGASPLGLDRATGTCPGAPVCGPVGGCPGIAGHARLGARGQLADLLELLAGGQLLGEQRRLDAVEQPLQPADELRLGHPDLALGRHLAVAERQGQHLQLVLEVRRQGLGQLGDGALVDLGEALPARLVERRGADLLEEHLDHRTDAHHLRRRGDGVTHARRWRPRPAASSGTTSSPCSVVRSGRQRRDRQQHRS